MHAQYSHGRRALIGALGLVASGVVIAVPLPALAAPTVFTAAGDGPVAIQTTVDAFRAALGTNNGNAPGSQPGGRREINWDGGGAAAPFADLPNPNNVFAFRGNTSVGVGGSTAFSGGPTPEFGNINPTYVDQFQTFSAPRLFAPLGSIETVASFNIPGDVTTQAVTNAFGVVFTDVDLADVTGFELFSDRGRSLGIYYAQAFGQGLSFVGVAFDTAAIGSARIFTGNTPLGPDDGGAIDVVAMDDFIFGEPQAVPAPASVALLGLGLAALAMRHRFPLSRT